jgi:hypothetical protein
MASPEDTPRWFDAQGHAERSVPSFVPHRRVQPFARSSHLVGCPCAVGASGNVATEDVVHLLRSLGDATGIDLPEPIDAGSLISAASGRETSSRVARAMSAGASAIPADAVS